MPASQRKEQILAAATSVFGERGYVGTTTDAIAKAAAVSQPYVVRMFGTKEELFLAVVQRALEKLLEIFRKALKDLEQSSPKGSLRPSECIGQAYVEMLKDRGLLLSLMHAFLLGSDSIIGTAARKGFLEVYRFLRTEAQMSAEEVKGFLSYGMLINTLVGLRMADEFEGGDQTAIEMMKTTFPTKLDLILEVNAYSKAK